MALDPTAEIDATARRRWFDPLVATGDDAGPTILRLTLALVIFPHGAQKLLGWFGGFGFSGTMEYFTATVGLPAVIALLVILIEFFGPIALAAGLFTRAAALGIGAVMVGAVTIQHLQHGFFMNWTGQQAGEGFEYHILVLGIVLVLLLKGSGALSLDRMLGGDRAGGVDRPALVD
ncbi:MAG: DoxX family protein [Gemmatimonadota bacterium]